MKAVNISSKNRLRKYNHFLRVIKPSGKDTILDVGFNNNEDSPVDNFLEKNYPFLSNITALGVAEKDVFEQRYPEVCVVLYDGKKFPFEDDYFDIGWSNAVIEHVGNEEAQVFFLKELIRTCKRVYFTTPNRYFPFEVHTRYPLVHWFPKMICDKILSLTPKKWAAGDYMYLLSRKKLETILRRANIEKYEIRKNRFCGFTMDFSIVIDPKNRK